MRFELSALRFSPQLPEFPPEIAKLSRWSSTAMVERYSRAYTFEDAASRYKSIV